MIPNLQLSCVLCLLKDNSYKTTDNLMSRNVTAPCLLTLWSLGLSREMYYPNSASFWSLLGSLLESMLSPLLTSENFRSDLWLTFNA